MAQNGAEDARDYDKATIVTNQAQVRAILQRAEANTRAYPFFLTDVMNGRRNDGAVVCLQTFCLDALFRSTRVAAGKKRAR
jgi:hypothetical protein